MTSTDLNSLILEQTRLFVECNYTFTNIPEFDTITLFMRKGL